MLEFIHRQPLIEPANLPLDSRIHDVGVERLDGKDDDCAEQKKRWGISNASQASDVVYGSRP
jgi:hypothetical protein